MPAYIRDKEGVVVRISLPFRARDAGAYGPKALFASDRATFVRTARTTL
jgi:hypothetical protein